jgi:hypothetical protein
MMPIKGDILVSHAIRLVPSTLLAAVIFAAPAFAQVVAPPPAKPKAPAAAAAPGKPSPSRRALVSTSPQPT